jgi:transcriptional regulator with XRE-family HTH domain
MAGPQKIELGPAGIAVMGNVRRIREGQRLTYVELSQRLIAAGRPIPVLGLRRIERGERRVDVDDLSALASVLKTTVGGLMTVGACPVCADAPPSGFTCSTCGASGR